MAELSAYKQYAFEPPSGFRGVFRSDDDARAVYSEAAGIAQIIPRAIAVPVDAEDVALLVRWAAECDVPLIPRGSGSSMAGGAIGDGLIVDLSRIAWLDEVDVGNRSVRCGPGVLRDTIDQAARAVGLTFPVDPSSGAYCTVGGMTSTNSSGAHTLRYGSTRQWVSAVDCIFSDGSRAEVRRDFPLPDISAVKRITRRAEDLRSSSARLSATHAGVRKESSGYGVASFASSGSIVDLIVGSEGTLVLIVGLELRLASLHRATASALGAFASLEDAVAAAVKASDAGASTCELLDRTFLDVARSGGVKIPATENVEAILLAEVEGESDADCTEKARVIERAFRQNGATDVTLALDARTEHDMWELRHAASPVLSRLDPSLKSMQFIEDGCVPPDKLAEYVRGVRMALTRQNIRGVIFGHAGDAHMHVNPLIDVTAPDWRRRAVALLDEVTDLVARLGGTVSGEHGDGRLRAPLLSRVWPNEALMHFADVKRAFDPGNLFNPGCKLASEDAVAVDRVKYDPAIPPLPAAARAALARVEGERAYALNRLDLLDAAQQR